MKQFEIHLANLNPTVGAEINKSRPVLIVSPDEINDNSRTVIIAPITSKPHKEIPYRVEIDLEGKINYVALDQLRTLDKSRLFKFIDVISEDEIDQIKNILVEMFS